MKHVYPRYLYLLLFLIISLPSSAATFTENFDVLGNYSSSSTGYINNSYTRSGEPVTFAWTNGLRELSGTQNGSPKTNSGAYAIRLRNATSNWTATIATGGVGTFSVYVRRWDGSPIVDYVCEYSTDNGSSWTPVQNITDTWLGGTSAYKQVNGTINTTNGAGATDDIIIRIRRVNGERLMIDDFEMTDYAVALPPCTAPSQATNLSFGTVTSTSIAGSFTGSSADGYLVVQSTSSTLSGNPSDGTTYTAGNSLGGGTVVQSGTGTSFTANSLSANTQYYFFVFAYTDNGSCSGGPVYATPSLSGNETTDPLPTTVQLTATSGTVSESGTSYDITVSITNPGGSATTVDLELNSGNAALVSGFSSQTLTFPGSSSANQTVTLTLVDNSTCDGIADLEFELNNPSGGVSASLGTNVIYDLSITDDEFTSVSILDEDFESGNLNNWGGTGDWDNSTSSSINGSNSLKHDLSGVAGRSSTYYSYDSNFDLADGEVTWRFNLKNGNWDPSSSNKFWVYLVANQSSFVNSTVDGYAVGVNMGSTDDDIKLVKMTNDAQASVIVASTEDWSNNDLFGIEVTRSTAGLWTLKIDNNGDFDNLVSAGTGTNTDYTFNDYFGPAFTYSSSRAGQLWMDDISISQEGCSNDPTIFTSTAGPLAFGNVTINTTSTEQTYNVWGNNLTADIVVTAPVGYEMSTTMGGPYSTAPINLTPSSGTVASTPIYLVFKPTAGVSYPGDITHTSTGANQVDVALTGTGDCVPATDPSGSITGTTPSCGSTNISFGGSASAPVINYWQTTYSGTSTADDAASSLNVTTTGSYFVRGYNTTTQCWSDLSMGPYAVTINAAPTVTTPPSNSSINVNDNTTFSVTATNTTDYQWQVDEGSGFSDITNGGVYSNATTNTLTITGATLAMDGYDYRCVVSAAPCADATSADAELTVINAIPVPDDSCAFNNYATMTFNVATNLVITDVNVGVKITTPWRGDLIIKLESPDGTEITILNNVGGSVNNIDALFDDAGTAGALSNTSHTVDGTYDVTAQVEGALTSALSTFNGEESQGDWILKVCDDAEFDLAYLNDFEVIITGTIPCTSTASITSFGPTSGPEGTMVTITGTGFTGALGVKFDDVSSASYTVVSATTITAEVPVGATTGKVKVTDASGCDAKSSTDFTILDESGTCGNGTTASELFISEIYDATTGDFHFIEIFNGTASAVNLSSYSVRVIAYGNNGSSTIDIPLNNFSLAAGAVYLVSTGNSSNTCSGVTADQSNTAGGFNGNDEVMLRKSGSTIDFVENPGQGAGFSQTRAATVTAPSSTYVSSEWTNTSTESCSDLGTSPYAAGPSIDITAHPADAGGCSSIAMSVTATGSGTLAYQWYYNDGSSTSWTILTTLPGATVTGATSNSLSITGTVGTYDNYQFYCEVSSGSCTKYSDAAQYTAGSLPVYRSVTDGNWTTISLWEIASTIAGPWGAACNYPTAANSDEVIVINGDDVVLDIDVSIDKLTIENGASLELATSSTLTILNGNTGADLIVDGTIIDRSAIPNSIAYEDNSGTANDASWTLGANGTIIKTNTSNVANYRDFYEGGISNIPATADWYYRYNGDGLPNTVTIDMFYPNLYFENTANTGNYAWDQFGTIFSGQLGYATVKGDLNLGVTGTGTVTVLNNNFNAQPMLIEGDLYIESGNSLTIEADAALSPANYNVNYGHGTGFEIKGSMLIDGTMDINHSSAGTINFTGAGTQDVLGSGTIDIWDTDINNTGTVDLGRTIVVNNDIDLIGGTLDGGGQDITVKGNWTNTGAIYTHSNNKVIFDGTSTTLVRSNGQTFYDVEVNSASVKVMPSVDDMEADNETKVITGEVEVPASRKITTKRFDQSAAGSTMIRGNATLDVNR